MRCHVNSIMVVAEVATENSHKARNNFVIVMEIKHQHWAIYLPLRTTHNSSTLLTPEALAGAQSILPRATMPSSGCNIFNNNVAQLFLKGGMLHLMMVFKWFCQCTCQIDSLQSRGAELVGGRKSDSSEWNKKWVQLFLRAPHPLHVFWQTVVLTTAQKN